MLGAEEIVIIYVDAKKSTDIYIITKLVYNAVLIFVN